MIQLKENVWSLLHPGLSQPPNCDCTRSFKSYPVDGGSAGIITFVFPAYAESDFVDFNPETELQYCELS